jgi:hypothetical protein
LALVKDANLLKAIAALLLISAFTITSLAILVAYPH